MNNSAAKIMNSEINIPLVSGFIDCPECKSKVNRIGNIYSLKGHSKKCSLRGKKIFEASVLDKVIENGKAEHGIIWPKLEEIGKDEPQDEFEKARPFYPYQRKVYDWALDKDRVAFFLEMRLGKT